MVTATEWEISGTYFEACNCEIACPCVFLSAPTTGDCTVSYTHLTLPTKRIV